MQESKHAVVLGAGLSGLITAYYLTQANSEWRVTVLEKSASPGGSIRSTALDGFVLEHGPVFLPLLGKGRVWLELALELGLQDQMVLAQDARQQALFLCQGNRLQRCPLSPLALWASPMSPGFLAAVLKDWLSEPLLHWDDADESLAAFCERHFGVRLTRAFIEPLVRCLLAGDVDKLSVNGTFPALRDLEASHGSVLKAWRSYTAAANVDTLSWPQQFKQAKYLTFRNGLQTLTDRLAQLLGNRIIFGAPVHRVEPQGDHFNIYTAGANPIQADRVVSTLSGPVLAPCVSFDSALSHALSQLSYAPLANISLAYDRCPKIPVGMGHLGPSDDRQGILTVWWSHVLAPPHAPPGQSLFSVTMGGAKHSLFNSFHPQYLIRQAADHLSAILGLPDRPLLAQCSISAQAIHQYNLDDRLRHETINRRSPRHFYASGIAASTLGSLNLAYNAKHLALNIAQGALIPGPAEKVSLA